MTEVLKPISCVCSEENRYFDREIVFRLTSLVDSELKEAWNPTCPDGETFAAWSVTDGLGPFSPAAGILSKQQLVTQQNTSAAAKQQAAAAAIQRLAQQRKSLVRKRKIEVVEPQPFMHFDDLRNHVVRYRHENVLHMRDASEKPPIYRPNMLPRGPEANLNSSTVNAGTLYTDSGAQISYADMVKQSLSTRAQNEVPMYTPASLPNEKTTTSPYGDVSRQRFQAAVSQLQRVISNQDIAYVHQENGNKMSAQSTDNVSIMQLTNASMLARSSDTRSSNSNGAKLLQSRPELSKTRTFTTITNAALHSNPLSGTASSMSYPNGSGGASVLGGRERADLTNESAVATKVALHNKVATSQSNDAGKMAQLEFARQLEDRLLAVLQQQRNSNGQLQLGSRFGSASRDEFSNAMSTSNPAPAKGVSASTQARNGTSVSGSARSNNGGRLQRPVPPESSRLSIATFSRQAAVLGLEDDRERVLLRTVQVKPIVGARPPQSNALLRAARAAKMREKRTVNQ